MYAWVPRFDWLWWRQTLSNYHVDAYATPKLIYIDMWQLALLHKLMQVGVLMYIMWGFFAEESWAVVEIPAGSFNAWVTTGSFMEDTNVPSFAQKFPYCASSANLYADGPDFLYDNPVCTLVKKDQVSEKTPSSIFITTLSQDTEEWYYPCSESRACDGTLTARANGQCICETRTVRYPVGVESLKLNLEHAFKTSVHSSLLGSSNVDGPASLDTHSEKRGTRSHTHPSPSRGARVDQFKPWDPTHPSPHTFSPHPAKSLLRMGTRWLTRAPDPQNPKTPCLKYLN